MPSGDAQRTWFPEMVARLQAEWHKGMSIPALIGLRDELDETLHRIRAGRNIQTAIITCRRCGMTGHAAEPRVSVRSLILALARFEIASKDQTRALEKDWAAYRKQHRLDIEGRALVGVPQSCLHQKIAAKVHHPRTCGSEFLRSHAQAGRSGVLHHVLHFRLARHSPATDSSSTRESCILGIVIELLRIDRGGWVALFPGNCSTYGFVDIH